MEVRRGQLLYHGTKCDFAQLDLSYAGTSDPGLVGKALYFTPHFEQATVFATSKNYGLGDFPTVVEASVALKNPAYVDDGHFHDGRTLSDAHPRGISARSAAALKRQLTSAGHDGVIFKVGGHISQVAVYDAQCVTITRRLPVSEVLEKTPPRSVRVPR